MPLEIPVSQGDNEGKSKLDVSNPYLRQQLKGFCRDEGLEIDSSIDHLGIDKGTCLRRLGKKSQQGERLGKGEWVLSKTLEVFQRQYLRTGAQKKSSLWAMCQLGSGVTQDAMCKYVWVKHNECKICGELGTEKHRLHHCNWSKKNLRLQRSAEVRAFEDIAKGDHKCWLWKEWELCLSLEPCRRRALLIMRWSLAARSIGCRKTRKSGTRTSEDVQRQDSC